MTKILINLTGDYLIDDSTSSQRGCVLTDPNLHELDAFLGALRGAVNVNQDLFLGAISSAVNQIKTNGISSLVLEVTTDMKTKNEIKHTFKLMSH